MYEATYSTSWDNLVKALTIAVYALLISLTVAFGLLVGDVLFTAVLIALYGSVLFFPYLWAPRGYTLSGDVVSVRRPLGEVKISIAQSAQRWDWTWWGLRLIGSGGLYGYFGIFTFKRIGRVRMYATSRHRLVLIRDAKGRKYLLSPDEPERFIQQTQTLFSTRATNFS
jgi:hypothetical protein